MGVPIPTESQLKINLSHQEVARIIEELEKSYSTARVEWLAADPIAELLCRELGYEDMEEFKDALGGEFEDLLQTLPDVETIKTDDGQLKFKMIPEPPEEEWKPRRMTLKITERSQVRP